MDIHSPVPSRESIIEPAGSDTEMEADIPTRPVSPEGDPNHNLLPTFHPRFRSSFTPPDPTFFNRDGIEPSLLERFPLIISHFPRHQPLWDQLSVGTLFTVAKVASELQIDLDKADPERLRELIGRNNVTMERVEEVLRRARGDEWIKVEKPDPGVDKEVGEVSRELDWEAEQIVNGTGEMHGWREEPKTRYGGKVQFAATLRLDEKMSQQLKSDAEPLHLDHCAQVTLEAPRLRGSSIFARTFGSHHFLRVRVSKKIQDEMSVWTRSNANRENARKELRQWAARPIFILGRVYAPLTEKDDVIIYFLEGRERVGAAFEKGKRDYGITECTTVPQFINWWSPLRYNGHQDIQKLLTRLELGLSDTLPGMMIMPENIQVANDIGTFSQINRTSLMRPSER
jgi:RNA dependent RNA polymerase